jgi:hypothetical protein
MASANPLEQPLVDEVSGVSDGKITWWRRPVMKICLVVVAVMFIGLACLLVLAPPSKGVVPPEFLKTKSASVQDVLKMFPNPMSVKDTNELFERLPAHEQEDMVAQHFVTHSQSLFANFLQDYGSSAPHWKTGAKISPRHKFEDDEEFKHRLGVFESNLREIIRLNNVEAKHNSNPNRAIFAIGEFADWSWSEFQTLMGRQSGVKSMTDAKSSSKKFQTLMGRQAGVKNMKDAKSSSKKFQSDTNKGTGQARGPSDSCRYSNDGVCDEPQYCSRGTDCTDCNTCATGPSDSCRYSNDGVCDEPQYCARGTDCTDCNTCQAPPPRTTPCDKNWAAMHPSVFTARQQGTCGSCYAHAAVETLRAVAFVNSGIDPGPLSVQYAMDCAGNGCNGGDAGNVMNKVAQNGGVPTKSDYGPYYGSAHACKSGIPKTVTTSGAMRFSSEPSQAAKLCSGGPLSMGVAANTAWQHYRSGVISKAACPANRANHDTEVVGLIRSEGAWLIRNSWGTGWGINPSTLRPGGSAGFIMVQYGQNTCNVEDGCSWPKGVRLLHRSANNVSALSTGVSEETRLV